MISENLLGDIFEECIPLFIALGDRTRLTILQCLFETQTTGEGRIPGLNVNEITDRTSLSRPAVSHHLKILKDTGLIDVLRKGVCNYYYLTNKSAIDKLGRLKEELEKYPESTLLQPYTRNIECLLRTYFPVTSNINTVHKNDTLSPAFHIHKCISDLSNVKVPS